MLSEQCGRLDYGGHLVVCKSSNSQVPQAITMLLDMQMRDRDLRPDEAAQYAQQIMAGRIRISELGAVSSAANQEHMVGHLLACMWALFWSLHSRQVAL